MAELVTVARPYAEAAFRLAQESEGGLDRWSDTLDTHGFVAAPIGQRVVFTNGSENRTFSGLVGQGGAITDLIAPGSGGKKNRTSI